MNSCYSVGSSNVVYTDLCVLEILMRLDGKSAISLVSGLGKKLFRDLSPISTEFALLG